MGLAGTADDVVETNPRGRVLRWLALACMTCSVPAMALALLVGFVAWMGGQLTPTQAAYALWALFAVPMAGVLVWNASRNAARYFAVLAFGWATLAGSGLFAVLMFPRYPAVGPHEWLALAFFVLPVALTCGGWTWMAVPDKRALVASLTGALAICVTAASVRLCWPGIHADLPLSAREVRRFVSVDIMGHGASYGHARLSHEAFEAFVRVEGLTQGGGMGWPMSDFAPEWFQPTEDWTRYTDAREDALCTEEHWSWYRVWRRGDEVYFTSGRAWR